MPPTFRERLAKCHEIFNNMKPGEMKDIAKMGESDPELFMAVCKDFIDNNPDFEISNDYKYFKRINNYNF